MACTRELSDDSRALPGKMRSSTRNGHARGDHLTEAGGVLDKSIGPTVARPAPGATRGLPRAMRALISRWRIRPITRLYNLTAGISPRPWITWRLEIPTD